MTVTVDVQSLVNSGWRICRGCAAVAHPTYTTCTVCGAPMTPPAKNVTTATKKARRRTVASMTKANALGGLAALPNQTLAFTVEGTPIPEGSVNAVAAGVVTPANKALNPWRRTVNAAAREATGARWEPVNGPVFIDVVFTVPRPTSAPSTKAIYPATKPDLDKLLRAIGDALSPKEPERRIIAEDSRIVGVGVLAKTHPTPLHTHPDAMSTPGVTVRIYPAPNPDDVTDSPTDGLHPRTNHLSATGTDS